MHQKLCNVFLQDGLGSSYAVISLLSYNLRNLESRLIYRYVTTLLRHVGMQILFISKNLSVLILVVADYEEFVYAC